MLTTPPPPPPIPPCRLLWLGEASRGQVLCSALGGAKKRRPGLCLQELRSTEGDHPTAPGGMSCSWLLSCLRPSPMLFPPLATPFLPSILPSYSTHQLPLLCKFSLTWVSIPLSLIYSAFSFSPSLPSLLSTFNFNFCSNFCIWN